MNKYLISPSHVLINGIPSQSKLKELTEEETKRLSEQKEKLGPEGLKEKAKEVQKAKKENEVS